MAKPILPSGFRTWQEDTRFVKRYFPYVEKLMPTIKFLRDTLNFGDAVIRKICTFEFFGHFKTDGAVYSLKQDTEGRFDFNIDGVSHVRWFIRKKDEFMETLGMPQENKIGVLSCKS